MKETNPISDKSLAELLSAYYDNSLSDSQKLQLEQDAKTDTFLLEAMEGLDQFPEAISEIPQFTGSTSYSWLWMSSLAGVIMLAGWLYISSFKSGDLPASPSNEVSQVAPSSSEPVQDGSPEREFAGMDNDFTEIITPSINEAIKKDEEKRPVSLKKKESTRLQITLPKMELSSTEFQQKIDYSVKKAKTKALGYFGFLAVDYSQIYTSQISTETNLGGTDASKANLKANSSAPDNGTEKVTYSYKEFLKKTCYLMQQRSFEQAIAHFTLILEEFPNDVNAEFYLGYCAYELGNYQEAIPFFEKARANSFDFFEEDAHWFLANSHENIGNRNQANKLYKEIQEKGGYYSRRIN